MNDREPAPDHSWLRFEDARGKTVRPHIEMDKRRKSAGWWAGTLLALLLTFAIASGLVWIIAMIWRAIL